VKKFFILLSILILSLPFSIAETNGTNLIGYGTKSLSMGGADVAWINDINAINLNPAGLAFIDGDTFGLSLSLLTPFGHHEDVFGNNLDSEVRVFPLPTIGYATKLSPNVAIGLGVFAHGGMGVTYDSMATAFGTMDTLDDTIMHL
jgi:long-subunit fatty acid transport protein